MSVDSRFAAPALASLKDCALDDPRLPTPLFVIDSQKLEKNLRRAQDRAAKLGVAFRPHLKTHKSIGIALRQMTTPQGPATVSTLAEARYFGARGVTDLIYAVGIAPQKLAEVSRLRSLGADIKIILDSAEAARAVSAFCSREKTTIPVLLEIDVDGHRSGIRPDGAELLPAAAALADGAELVGVLTHAGDSYECKTTAEIEAAAEAERAGIVLAAERLRAAGHTVKIVSAGSTPTLMFAKDETGVTEMRAGVCALFDLFMSNVGACTVDDIAGSVLATVIGRQVDKRRVILDCGFLALSRDRGTAPPGPQHRVRLRLVGRLGRQAPRRRHDCPDGHQSGARHSHPSGEFPPHAGGLPDRQTSSHSAQPRLPHGRPLRLARADRERPCRGGFGPRPRMGLKRTPIPIRALGHASQGCRTVNG